MSSIENRRERFAALHRQGCFAIPNPWDVGSARYLRHAGFTALATTSAGLQFSRGWPDTVWGLTCEEVLAHVRDIVQATDLPVNADFQAGYAHDPDGVGRNVARCVDTGVAGLSIEDANGEPGGLYALPVALERLRAARAAIDAKGAQVLLTARAESYLVGHPQPLQDVLQRLRAYADAGADVLFAPGARTRDDLHAIVQAVAPKPVNVLVGAPLGLTLADLAELGVRRVSVGSGLARVAWGGFMRAARMLAEQGSFEGLSEAVPFAEINAIFASWASKP